MLIRTRGLTTLSPRVPLPTMDRLAHLSRAALCHPNRLSPSPFKLTILLFIWVLPYLFFTNYLERSLLPLRALCYTQADLLSTLPLSDNPQTCLSKFFPNSDPDPNCQLDVAPKILLRPDLPDNPQRILVIRTTPQGIEYRNFIRETWKQTVDPYAPVVFVCATRESTSVVSEAEEYKDILQFEFGESYHNLSWKMMAIYNFVLDELPTVKEIIVLNDDTIVNSTALQQIRRVPSEGPWIIGKVSRGYPRLFMPWLSWHVPGSMYPNLCYPRFTQGSSFILSREAARRLLANVCKSPFVHLDDVLVGIMSNCAQLEQHHHPGFDMHTFEDFVVYHYQYERHSADYLRALWHSAKDL